MAHADPADLPELRLPVLALPKPIRWAVVVAATIVAVAVASVCVGPLWTSDPQVALPTVLFAGALIAAGTILRSEPGQRSAAGALIVAGCLWPLGWIEKWGNGPWTLLALFGSPLALVLTAWAICRYPDAGQVGERERWLLRALAFWIIIGRLSVVVTSYPTWQEYPSSTWWPTLRADHSLNDILSYLSAAGEAALAVSFLGQWFWRVRRIRGLDRRLMIPVVVAALIGGIASAASPIAQLAGFSEPVVNQVFAVQSTLLFGVPVAFAVAALRRRLASTVIADLVGRLRGEPTPENVEQAFRQVLADPELRVYYWSPDLEDHVDRAGRPFDRSPNGTSLLLPVTTAANEPLAMIRADQALRRYPDLVAAAVSVGALAIQNAQLQVATRAQLAQVRASHARIVEAGQAERRVLERDLQTGALARILALIDSLAEEPVPPVPELTGIVSHATDQLTQVAAELQDIARGLHPSILNTVGFVEAVRTMGLAQPVPVTVDLPEGEFPPGVEVAAYYVVSEAITNAVRHARAGRISISGADMGGMLRLTVTDDGRGGADITRGTGLAGLEERLRALDGRLTLISPRGAGTTLVAEIPWESPCG